MDTATATGVAIYKIIEAPTPIGVRCFITENGDKLSVYFKTIEKEIVLRAEPDALTELVIDGLQTWAGYKVFIQKCMREYQDILDLLNVQSRPVEFVRSDDPLQSQGYLFKASLLSIDLYARPMPDGSFEYAAAQHGEIIGEGNTIRSVLQSY